MAAPIKGFIASSSCFLSAPTTHGRRTGFNQYHGENGAPSITSGANAGDDASGARCSQAKVSDVTAK
jgi:hypothetical protein